MEKRRGGEGEKDMSVELSQDGGQPHDREENLRERIQDPEMLKRHT